MKVIVEHITSAKRIDWLKRIMEIRSVDCDKGDTLTISFGNISVNEISPEHVVSLACLVESFYQKRVNIALDTNTECGNYFFNDLCLREYWANRQDYR